ncbi:MAG: hypothetical protein ABI865_10200, partial [Nitrosospira sp.]
NVFRCLILNRPWYVEMYGAAQLHLTNKIIITAFQTAINIVIKEEARDIHACNRSQHQKPYILWR